MPPQIGSPTHRFWIQLIARSAVLVAVAVLITFSPDHSPRLGLFALAASGLLLGTIALVGTRWAAGIARLRTVQVASGLVSIVIGASAAVVAFVAPSFVAFLVGGVALGVLTTVSELALVSERASGLPSAVDRRVLAVVSGLLVVGLLLSGGNSVVAVGLFGAWSAVTAVYSFITAFTLKWEGGQPAAPVETP